VSTAPAIDVVLRDGSTARVRRAGADDAPAVRDFLERLEPEARWFRFFSAGVNLESAARDAVTPADGRALLVLTGEDDRVVGHGMYARMEPGEAEVAFAVDGAWQGRGLATMLLAHLADAAADEGVTVFSAITLPGNHRMIGVFRDSGFPVEVRARPGELHIRFPTSLTPEGRRRFEARERDAAVAAVAHVLRPSSVLLVAAGAEPGTAGGEALRNLAGAGFTGTLHAVLAAGEAPAGVASARSIADVPGNVELAVLALAPEDVLGAARACATRGDVRALVVLLEGSVRVATDQLVAICRAAGMRLVGPHCLGVVNTDPAVALDATFAPARPAAGRVAFASQSGAFGIAALDLAAQRGVGLSSFVSMGAKADLSGNDLLQYWETDSGTDVVLLYLESFGNPRRFGQVARRVTARKPVIAVKSGRAPAAPRPDSSQTGALLTASDTHVDALFRHAGVIRTDTLGEMFDLAGLLARQPPPRGDRVAIVTNAGGLGLQCADACAAAGLCVAPLGEPAQRALEAALPAGAAVANPVDVSAVAGAADYERALVSVLADPGVDAVIVLFARSLATPADRVAAVVDAAASRRQPVLAVFMGADAPPVAAGDHGAPRFAAPEEAVRALSRAREHARRLARPPDELGPLEGVDSDRAAAIIATGLAEGGGWLPPPEVEALLHCYGLRTAPSRAAATPRGAVRAAARLGGPVAVKALAPGLVQKSDAGAVRTGVTGPTAVERAAREVLDAAREHGYAPEGVLVQAMAGGGTELLLGIAGDPRFGPLVALAAGGATAELVGDVQVRLAPIGPSEAGRMIAGLRGFPLLEGFRGRPRADIAALRDAVLRVGALAAGHPELAELDCNPLVAGPAGAVIVDARARLEPPLPHRPYAAVGRV
jgi:acyl-CoA synthetase (NDP forming)/GNAT superfamily N-acetyltransferase